MICGLLCVRGISNSLRGYLRCVRREGYLVRNCSDSTMIGDRESYGGDLIFGSFSEEFLHVNFAKYVFFTELT